MAISRNRDGEQGAWRPDIERSVSEYNAWYLAESPGMWSEARKRAVAEVEVAMEAFRDFRDFSTGALAMNPRALFVARMAVSPTMARDRLVEFAAVSKTLVLRMELDGRLPTRVRDVDLHLQRICDFLVPRFDPDLFPWIGAGRAPAASERDRALLLLGERLAGALYHPVLRNSQEARQKALMGEFLRDRGFEESAAPTFELPPGSFVFGRNVPVLNAKGKKQNLPVDCVVAPLGGSLPLGCVEMKSAGDYTNVNKRRKEEANKHDALARTHGDAAIFLLQLFGYFDPGYLAYEASAGIDWAWDHRLADLNPYFGLS